MQKFSTTRNACKLCNPLGACVAFCGIERCVPFLHGSQGCSTYIRRYLISHFREPVDIASSSFSEESAIFGGRENLYQGLKNVTEQYMPSLIGIATTCLSETIGDDVSSFLHKYRKEFFRRDTPLLVNVSTPSYRGTHMDGFHQTVKALVESLVTPEYSGLFGVSLPGKKCIRYKQLNIFPGFISCADIRHLKEILNDFDMSYVLLPDYSDTLDAPLWDEYKRIPEGGTLIEDIANTGSSCASIEFGMTLSKRETAGSILLERFKVPLYNLGLPIGINETDIFFRLLEKLSGRSTPGKYTSERGRLIDAYVDGHKYVFEKRAIVYGEEDLVAGIASFLSEIGIVPVVLEGVDFAGIAQEAEKLSADLIIGNSKGSFLSRKLGIPLVRVGFPIHDRIGGQRILHLGYRGTQDLFDRIVNALIEKKQDSCSVGYSYV